MYISFRLEKIPRKCHSYETQSSQGAKRRTDEEQTTEQKKKHATFEVFNVQIKCNDKSGKARSVVLTPDASFLQAYYVCDIS